MYIYIYSLILHWQYSFHDVLADFNMTPKGIEQPRGARKPVLHVYFSILCKCARLCVCVCTCMFVQNGIEQPTGARKPVYASIFQYIMYTLICLCVYVCMCIAKCNRTAQRRHEACVPCICLYIVHVCVCACVCARVCGHMCTLTSDT